MAKAYRLTEDLKVTKPEAAETVIKWCEEGLNKKLSQEEWEKKFEELYEVLVPKGTIFFKSKLFSNKDNEPYLYPNSMTNEVLEPRDLIFGTNGIVIEDNVYKLWNFHLTSMEYTYSKGKFEEVEIEDLSFEQIHIVEFLKKEIAMIEKAIVENREEIKNITNKITQIL